ncbi:metal-dependent hydrolase [Hymenobacter sp. CRA2]|uniref:metal-dependent hydrolase n=1 Tax=Hymenobacter sp. CRA2 TaxID=1955620 RepID=UPI00098F5B2B|nr:metal-dependent hydrolase [Hymenobacter sp. CRA2]OON67237.1 hypothetical protein B0919_19105 [Hymenobacter sp. CRA2]
MPTIFTHAAVALGLGRIRYARQLPTRFWLLTALCAIAPDFDAVTFKLGIPYASMWGHRGFTHSLVFAALLGLLLAYGAWPRTTCRAPLVLWFFLATASHPLLDMLTNGGLGVALLAPFSAERFFFPWRPVQVSPVGAGFFSARGVTTVLSELKWLWLPTALAVGAVQLWRRRA